MPSVARAWAKRWRRHACPDPAPPPAPDPDSAPTPEPEPAPTPVVPVAPPPFATLVDAAGTPFADLGRVDVGDSLLEVPAASGFSEPVVILGPPTRHEADPGIARVEAVFARGFQLRFQEFSDRDGVHASERVSYLVLAPGRYRLADGSEWEVGSFDVGGAGAFFDQSFAASFATPPALFLTVQSRADEAPVVVRARAVDASGFQVALQEEEAEDGLHAPERVGYLAIASAPGSGQLASTADPLPYLVRALTVGNVPVPMLSGSLALEEETSADEEVAHLDETVAYLAVGPEIFAQAVSDAELDPMSVRRDAPEHDGELEWGTVTGVDHRWHMIPLSRRYADPIVVAGPVSNEGVDPGVLRVANVRGDAFELRFQEWAYLDDVHGAPERAFYLVAERGVQSVGGLVLEASSHQTDRMLRDGLEDFAFTLPFAEVPGVFASVTTYDDPQPVTLRLADRTTLGFRMTMQAEEAAVARHGFERLDWIAIQSGEGSTSNGRRLRVFDTSVAQPATTVPLGDGLRGRFPTILGQITTLVGRDPYTLRFDNLGADRVDLIGQEEKSKDAETSHAAETVSVFVAE